MTKFFPFFWWLIGGMCLIVGLSWLWAGSQTWSAWQALERQQLQDSNQAASRAVPVLQAWSSLTFHQVPDLEVWRLSLELLSEAPPQLSEVISTLDRTQLEPSQSSSRLKTVISPWLTKAKTLTELTPKTWFIRHILGVERTTQINKVAQVVPLLETTVLTGDQTWLILFQNSQELRATGGFMGSLAWVTLHDGSMTKLEIQDIYQPDGQFKGYILPPPGVAEYLSSGQSWRLPDMNWSPDYPLTATQISDVLQHSGYPQVDGIVSLNLEIIAALLEITGEVYLPDYQTTITRQNLAEVLRQDREQFFPGSIAKQQLLASFATYFKLKLAALPPSQLLPTITTLKTAAEQKQLQVFAANSELQAALESYNLAGQVVSSASAEWYLLAIESNVGINKANQGVSRSMMLNIQPTETELTLDFENQNLHPPVIATEAAQAPHLHYVNYQRLWLKPEAKITAITYNGQPIETWDEKLITTSRGETVKQIGFLITVLEQGQGQLQVTWQHPPIAQDSKIVIGKQSGYATLPVTLEVLGHTTQLNLTQDLITTPHQLQSP